MANDTRPVLPTPLPMPLAVPLADPGPVTLSPMADLIVDRAIDNMTRKLVAGYRNKANARPNARNVDMAAETRETLKAVSAESAMAVANRGQAWKEMVQKTLTHGISSLSTMRFDGEFSIRDGKLPEDFKATMPDGPGVYVVYDRNDRPVYVGDSANMRQRWHAGHMNEYRQGQKPDGTPYKLADDFTAGCTVRFLKTETKETAAAIEAHLIGQNFAGFEGVKRNDKALTPEQALAREEALEAGMLLNKRGELETEQGTRSNQDAKTLKDASGGVGSLAWGAGKAAAANVGYDLFERLTTTSIKAIKDELVDVVGGGKSRLRIRVERMLGKILEVIKGLIKAPMQVLRGLIEFVVNALSKTISQVYNLARNLFDLAQNAWQLYKGAQTMSREALVRKISETVIVSGSLVIWDALDLTLEKWISAQSAGVLAPFAPYLSAAIAAIGFGVSSHAMQVVVTRAIDAVIALKQGYIAVVEEERRACDQLILIAENELELLADLGTYTTSSIEVIERLHTHTGALAHHAPLLPLDLDALVVRRLPRPEHAE